jgi:hypothetical protein
MRLLELEINNIRGIRHLPLKLDGENSVIWGPNGSGKSAVVDAIDFLLTGRVLRLTGKGTSGLTLKTHGPHIDSTPKEARVRAVIQIPGVAEPIEISRCIAQPTKLVFNASKTEILGPVLRVALRGQHILTRREILKFITAEAGTRASEIQELLNLNEIEEIRKTLVKVNNDFDKELQAATRLVQSTEAAVNATVQKNFFDSEAVLKVVNQNRGVLGGGLISSINSSDLKSGLQPPTVVSENKSLNITLFERDVDNIRNLMLPQSRDSIGECDRQLRSLITVIQGDSMMLRALSLQHLTEAGLALIDDTGSCPLCDTAWPAGKLCEHLEKRLSTAQIAKQHRERIMSLSGEIARSVNTVIASLRNIVKTCQGAGVGRDLPILQSWLGELEELAQVLSNAVEKYPDPGFGADSISYLLAPSDLAQIFEHLLTTIKDEYPETRPEQTAWDTLTRLEENLKALEAAQDAFGQVQVFVKRSGLVLTSYQEARDATLEKLYANIRDRFVDLYRKIHGVDEEDFTANFEQDEARLNLEVDFHGRGMHPPHALHSEGHQDTMGLCLYLALAEHLTKDVIELIILDDVVMSVDADHRREICSLLSSEFPNKQFLITTHDRTWASQLKIRGVVNTKQCVEFYNWQLNSGPQVNCETDMWAKIEEDLSRNDITSAAAKLRRGSEEFFASMCDALEGKVQFKLNNRWELGDFLPGAVNQYKKLIKDGKQAANSWGNKAERERLQELESTANQIVARLELEKWAVNENVHYNNWANFTIADFRPVVEAFRDLFDLFMCPHCCSILQLSKTGSQQPAGVRCKCGEKWSLTGKH